MAKNNKKKSNKTQKSSQNNAKTTQQPKNVAKKCNSRTPAKKNSKKFKKKVHKITGKIGYCDNTDLGIKNMSGGHYVYIREKKGDECSVNVITSLEDKNQNFSKRKLEKVRKGYLYPIPINDADFSRWSAIDLNSGINDLDITKVKKIDSKKIKRRHKWFVGKFGK